MPCWAFDIRQPKEDDSGLFRTLRGGLWRFRVVKIVTAFKFVIVVQIACCRRGFKLVPGLGNPRILALGFFTQTDGGTVRALLTCQWDRQSLTPLWTAVTVLHY
jgi:hypothetical protein